MAGFDFEKPLIELDKLIQEHKKYSAEKKVDLSAEIRNLEEKRAAQEKEIYSNLTPWQRVLIARHPQRPYTSDYIGALMTDFVELHGDRAFSDDKALIGGLARLDGVKVMVMGHQKGRDIKENLKRNFGCAHPEGYRKALRLMQMAEKFDIPIVIFIDTPGAYPGIGAEERGQAQAIALNLREMTTIGVPIVATVIGEGGSGGALGIGVADRVCVLENAYYSVISPEGCAAILWKSSAKAPEAAEVLKLNAHQLLKLGIIDEVVPEPLGGAHRDYQQMFRNLKETVARNLSQLMALNKEDLLKMRYRKYRSIGSFS
ncbi:MAG TPA: acetyl-CoA carboxylase carboxyltransferase subunit alpha [Candidatus Omnitrophota bacterium]|nr:acetyl-CoA carboxylase carboxyltransferase subunit alpha [Candidatus Omnitrophota bacterium]HQJ14896.1 acetyl-CoA carboxylase carboxyltransferase subunit alpha [Candidatus Omnitrophota bacterium]